MTATQPLPVPAALPAPSRAGLVQGTLALDFTLPSGVPAVPRPPTLALVVGGTEVPGAPDSQHGCPTSPGCPASPVSPASSGRLGAPPPRAWAGRFVQAVVEVVMGDRPLQQLVRWTDERVYADLSRRVRILGLTTDAATRNRTERSQVRSVHIFQPRPDAAEVAAHVRHGCRSRAVAARLEADRGRWRCTALRLG